MQSRHAGSEPVVRTQGLTKDYGSTRALHDLDLEVPPGCIFGFLGPNGAGKSTTIRILMGSIRPTTGSATIFGEDTLDHRREVHRRVGYLAGDFAAYGDLTARQYLDHLGALRGGVDRHVVDALAERFGLDTSRRIATLSHGNRQKVGIVQACMHEPDLLILDEPTQGLDPLMQRRFLDLLREQRDRGGTVFLSSHILSEVEEVADVVAVIRSGELAAVTDVDTMKQRTRRRVAMRFCDPASAPVEELRAVGGVADVSVHDDTVQVVVEGSMDEMLRVAAPHGIERIVADEVDLEGVFLGFYEAD